MSEVLGKCPRCGNDVVGGKYGPYCVAKCGFSAARAFGHEFTEDEVRDLLAGKEVLLKDCVSKKDGEEKKYDMYVTADGIEDYVYKKKDGTGANGIRFKFKTRFPEKGEVEPEKVGKCPNCGNDVYIGKYGAYCSKKCGFTINKVFGKELTIDEAKTILAGEETLLKGLIHKGDDGEEKKYDMYVRAVDIEDFPYQKKDGTDATGIRYKFETRFPEKVKNPEETSGEHEDVDNENSDIDTNYLQDDLPFA